MFLSVAVDAVAQLVANGPVQQFHAIAVGVAVRQTSNRSTGSAAVGASGGSARERRRGTLHTFQEDGRGDRHQVSVEATSHAFALAMTTKNAHAQTETQRLFAYSPIKRMSSVKRSSGQIANGS